MIELLTQYDIALTDLNFEALVKLHEIYEQLIVSLKGESEAAESKDSDLKKALMASVTNDETVTSTVSDLKNQILHSLYTAIENDPRIILPLIEAVSEIKTATLDERDYWMQRVKRELTPKAVVRDEAYEAQYEEADKLAQLIRHLYPLLKGTVPTDDDRFPLTPVKKDGKAVKGEFLPVLSRLPKKSDDESNTPMGRNAGTRFLKFTWNGEPVEEGMLVNDLAHDLISDFKRGYVVSWRDIAAKVKESGRDMFDREPWTVEFETGTLTGYDPREKKNRPSSEKDSDA